MRRLVGLFVVFVAGCLDLNPLFVEPASTGGDGTTGSPTTTGGPTTTPTTTPGPGSDSDVPTTDPTVDPSTDPTVDPTVDPTTLVLPETEGSTAMPPGVCGDGMQNPGEACDDGNDDNTDDCLVDCSEAVCGDGYVHVNVESCDDGNLDDSDACISTCVPAECGDGNVQEGVEACDDANKDDTDACVACAAAKCGDGKVQAGVEACDDGNDQPYDGCEPIDCVVTTKYVFATSVPYDGKLGGVMGAHNLCEMHAANGGLPMVAYRAWISDANVSPSVFMQKSKWAYIKVNEEPVAADWMQLTSDNLLSAIDRDEYGNPAPAAEGGCSIHGVHTNTKADGTSTGLLTHCNNWTSNAPGVSRWGDSSKNKNGWSSACDGSCAAKAPIYCFQQ